MTIYEKIAKVQDEVQHVKKDADNPYFKSRYSTYENVLDSIHDSMRKYGLIHTHSFEPGLKDNAIVVITQISDVENDKVFISKLDIPLLKNDPQAAGSAITYAKRYALLAMLGLGTEDDDANSASKPQYAPATPENDVMEAAIAKNPNCVKCGAKMAKSTKGNWYCSAKCWLK
jgi:hypothetical protein